jgi:hypothetical protein
MTDTQDKQSETTSNSGISRRESIAAVGALVVGGVVGYELNDKQPKTVTKVRVVEKTPAATGTAANSDQGVQTFISRPDLRPPVVTMTNFDLKALSEIPRHITVALKKAPPSPDAQTGTMVLDLQGRLVWFQPFTDATFDANVQSYKGKPVLTYWSGDLVDGHGVGSAHILDHAYNEIKTITHVDGLRLDLHELNLTSHGSALVTAYSEHTADLRPVGGAKHGRIYAGHAFEVDLASGKVLWSWNSLDHVDPSESYVTAPTSGSTPYDYFHINSVSPTADGNILISGRSCCAMYKVSRKTGKIIWRLNGKKSDFKVAQAASFAFQHHTREIAGTGRFTVFDNATMNPTNPGYRSRGLLLDVDESARTVALAQEYVNPAAFVAMTQGSVQRLDDGKVLVGWGAQPYFSLFSADGDLLSSGEFAQGIRSYRAFAVDWTGKPDSEPTAVASVAGTGGFVIHVSWNGATEVHRWVVLAGKDKNKLTEVGSQRRTGFETAIVVNSVGPSFQVVAVDKHDRELGRSAVL